MLAAAASHQIPVVDVTALPELPTGSGRKKKKTGREGREGVEGRMEGNYVCLVQGKSAIGFPVLF